MLTYKYFALDHAVDYSGLRSRSVGLQQLLCSWRLTRSAIIVEQLHRGLLLAPASWLQRDMSFADDGAGRAGMVLVWRAGYAAAMLGAIEEAEDIMCVIVLQKIIEYRPKRAFFYDFSSTQQTTSDSKVPCVVFVARQRSRSDSQGQT